MQLKIRDKRNRELMMTGKELAVFLYIGTKSGSYSEIKRQLDLNDSTLANILQNLIKWNLIKKDEGLYVLTPLGQSMKEPLISELKRRGLVSD